ncbi:TPA: polysaccharide biosynthesis protein, partial [Streptococcus suis]
MYQPFIELWVGPENLLDMKCVVLFAVYFCVYEISLTISTYKDASGKWHVDRFRPLLTAIVNLVTNIILVKYIGLYGVLLSTILSFLIVNIPWL